MANERKSESGDEPADAKRRKRGSEDNVDEEERERVKRWAREAAANEKTEDEEEDDEESGGGEPEEEEEARRPQIRKSPGAPSKREIQEHRVTHSPYRSWCPECVRARGKATSHFKLGQGSDEKEIPGLHIDYWFMRDKRAEESVTIALLKDDMTKAVAAHAVPHKGDHSWISRMMSKDISDFGHSNSKVTLKCDQEPAILDLADAIMREREGDTVLEEAKVKDSQSNGVIERCVQTHEGMTRTMKFALEKRVARSIPSVHPVMKWMVEHAAGTLNRCEVGKDGRTAYERIRGKKYRGEAYEFGRKVFHRVPGKVEGGSMESRWETGIFVGKRAEAMKA